MSTEAPNNQLRNRQTGATSNLSWSPEQIAAYYQSYGYVGNHQHNHGDNYHEMWQRYHQHMNSYMQHYYSQWSTVPHPSEPVPTTDTALPPLNQAPPDQVPPAAQEVVNRVEQRMNAQGGAFGAAMDDEGEQDWLDGLFALFRYGFFFSILYFYSDWKRILLIACFALIIYIYQAGIFRVVRRPLHPEGRRNDAPAEENRAETDDNSNNNDNTPNDENVSESMPQPPPPSIFTTAWCFISTFFSSLLPQPPAVA